MRESDLFKFDLLSNKCLISTVLGNILLKVTYIGLDMYMVIIPVACVVPLRRNRREHKI